MLLPTRCPVCLAIGPAPCDRCAALLRPAPTLALPAGVTSCVAVLAYEGAGREVIARLKYRNARASVPRLGAAMANLVDAAGVDVVTWVPTTAARQRARGFDQSALLAQAVARSLRLPCCALLRHQPGLPQTGRARRERRRGPEFTALRPCPPRVLLVDDVVTTGATIASAASTLLGAGGAEVRVVAAAATPAP